MKPIYIQELFNGTTPEVNKVYWQSVFDELLKLDWLEETSNRKEYMMAENEVEYTYGAFGGDRTYKSKPFHPEVKFIMNRLNEDEGIPYNVCFLNRYDNEKSQLGWHADLFDKAVPNSSIAVVSLGSEREIWWKEKTYKGVIPPEDRQKLANGSLFIMPEDFQEHMLHRIPKWDQPIGPRISLTFRKFLLENLTK